jgi:hypothetical protein
LIFNNPWPDPRIKIDSSSISQDEGILVTPMQNGSFLIVKVPLNESSGVGQ